MGEPQHRHPRRLGMGSRPRQTHMRRMHRNARNNPPHHRARPERPPPRTVHPRPKDQTLGATRHQPDRHRTKNPNRRGMVPLTNTTSASRHTRRATRQPNQHRANPIHRPSPKNNKPRLARHHHPTPTTRPKTESKKCLKHSPANQQAANQQAT